MAFLRGYSLQVPPHHLHLLCGLVPFPTSYICVEALLAVDLCLMWLRATISRFRGGIHCPVISNGSTLRLQLIVLWSRRK